MKLTLSDLQPKEATFELSSFPDKKFILRKFTLRDKIWCQDEFGGSEKINELFAKQNIVAICKIAHHLLKEKEQYPTFEDFADVVSGPKDEGEIYVALLETIGLSKAVLQKLVDQEAAPSPNA